MLEWKPIDTAPWSEPFEEKHWVLLYCVPVNNPYNKARVPEQVQAYRTMGLTGKPYWATQECTIDVCVMTPTHWMPLLPAPE